MVTTIEIEFHRHTHGKGIEDRFFLGRKASGEVYVRQQWAADPSEGTPGGGANLSVPDFLHGAGERQTALLKLIGTLIPRQ